MAIQALGKDGTPLGQVKALGKDGTPLGQVKALGKDGTPLAQSIGEDAAITPIEANNSKQIHGSNTDDTLVGGFEDEIIFGYDGNDHLDGNGNDDVLVAGAGEDIGLGGSGNDTLYGGQGTDILRGGNGNDEIYGGDGDDFQLIGDSGNDAIFGGAGVDRIQGASIFGTKVGEVDTLTGGASDSPQVGGDGRKDTFIMGMKAGFSPAQIFYDDRNSSTAGLQDYAVITDFEKAHDTMTLVGEASDYQLGASPIQGLAGTALFLKNSGGPNELLAVIRGDTNLNLNDANNFTFV